MTSAPAPVGDNRRSDFHHRFPIGRRNIGNQHITSFKAAQLPQVLNDSRVARGNFAAYRMARDNRICLVFKHILLQNHPAQLGYDGFRPRLNNVQGAVNAILRPFYIHRLGLTRLGAVVFFYLDGVIGQG